MAYTSENIVEDYLKRDLETNEVTLLETVLIPAIKQYIDSYTSSSFDQVDETDRLYDGEDISVVDIEPCTEISAIKFIDPYGVVIQTLDTSLYKAYPLNKTVKTYIKFRGFSIQPRLAHIQVSAKFSEYDGGVPADIQIAATKMAAYFLTEGDVVGISEEIIEGHRVMYDLTQAAASDPTINAILDQHKDYLVG